MRKKSETYNILARIGIRAAHIMKADICIIWLQDNTGELTPVFRYGVKEKFANLLFSEANLNILKGTSKTDNPSQIYDLRKCAVNNLKNLIEEEKIESFLACPICERGKHIGVIAICTRDKHRKFTQTEKVLFSTFADEAAFAVRNETLSCRIKRDYLNTIRTIAHILEASDTYTYGHSNKVMRYSINICKILKLNRTQIHNIKNAALLHDIGKIGIDQEILRKDGKITSGEWEEIKKHPIIGAGIIEKTGFLHNLVPIIKHHHERYEGGGYPNPSLKGKNIPLGAKIIAVADAFDAMTSARPYRKTPFPVEMALSEIRRNAGTQFDPEIAKIFLNSMSKKTVSAQINFATV